MELHIVDQSNVHLYQDAMRMNFRLRADIFVKEMGWRALQVEDGLERDCFDTTSATHYLAIDGGRVAGSTRRHCSLEPTLLSEVFPHMASRGFARAADVYEATRICVARPWRTKHPNRVAGLLTWALWAHTFQQGGRAVNLVTYAGYVPQLMRSGLRPRPLGLPTPHEDMELMAVETAVDEAVLQSLVAYYGFAPTPWTTTGITLAREAEAA